MSEQTEQKVEQTTKRRMPRWLKATLITLGSLVGLVVLVFVLACYLIFTPARLTSIVNKLSDKYILCESSFEKVDLTLFRTFPDAGLELKNVYLVNPLDDSVKHGAQVGDTLARLNRLTVAVNVRDFLKNRDIKVTQLLLDDVEANVFISDNGTTNFDIFPPSSDTTESEPFEIPENIDIKKISVSNLNCIFNDVRDGMKADVRSLDLSVDGRWQNSSADAKLKMSSSEVAVVMKDSLGSETLNALLHQLQMKVKGEGPLSNLKGALALSLPQASVVMDGMQYVTDYANQQSKDLLKVDMPFSANLDSMAFSVTDATLALAQFVVRLTADAQLADESRPLTVDARFSTNGWQLAEFLPMLPAQFTSWAKTMDVDGELKLEGTAVGSLTDTTMPLVDARLTLADGHFTDKSLIPYELKKINGDVAARLNLSQGGKSNATINSLTLRFNKNDLALTGELTDVLGDLLADLNLKGNVNLPDLAYYYPESLSLQANGKAKLDVNAKATLDQITAMDLKSMKVSGTVSVKDLDVNMDNDILATSPKVDLAIQIPAKKHTSTFKEMLSARITGGKLHADVRSSNISADLISADVEAGISDIMDDRQPLMVAATFKVDKLTATMDTLNAILTAPEGSFEMVPDKKDPAKVRYKVRYNNSALYCKVNDSLSVNLAGLSVSGSAYYDSTRANVLQQWSPNLDVDFKRGYVNVAQLPYVVQIPDIKFNYKPERCEIASANIVFGNSDYYLSGSVTGLEKWISHEDMLRGDLSFTSNYTNVDDLMEVLSGLGTDADTLEKQRQEDKVAQEANPFIVPKDVDFTLHTRIKDLTAFGNDLQELGGNVTVKDGVAVLDQVGFVCKAAKMQLTAIYKTPRVNHIFVGLDFHLLDIGISELVDMIPMVDTLVPMISAFDGNADFHLCAETYVNAFYQPKMSTLRGVAALTGKDLVVLDNETFDKISKLMLFKKKTKNVIDSLDVEMTVFRKEVEMYPFEISMDKYQVVASGRHNLNNSYDYHLEIVQSPLPNRLAVDVLGVMPKLGFKLSKCRYAEMYKPEKRNELQKQTLEMKALIRKSLEANVKADTRQYKGLTD